MRFLGKLETFLNRAGLGQWDLAKFDDELNELLQDHEFNLKCPSLGTLWTFHRDVAVSFQAK
jgi:hypothetical protein